MTTPTAPTTRSPFVDEVPLSVRHPWHRASLLGVFVALFALPWSTSSGCSGDQPPLTETGFQLFASTVSDEPLFVLAPLALVVAALLGIFAQRVQRAGRRAWLSLAMLLLVAGGAFFTWVTSVLPHAAEKVEQHFAAHAGTIALVAVIVDALVRLVLGVREWWVQRRTPSGRRGLPWIAARACPSGNAGIRCCVSAVRSVMQRFARGTTHRS